MIGEDTGNNLRLLSCLIMIVAFLFCSTSYADSRLDNCLSYYDEIVSALESEGVSPDYFYLAVCESGCKNVESNKGAHGFFQMTRPTFNSFKSTDCSDIYDIKCNTIAAARYIKHLQKRFKHMNILIYAYNMGGTNLIKRGSPTKEARGLSLCVMKYLK